MTLNILNPEDRVFKSYGSVEIRDSDGEIIPMDEFEKIMPTVMKRGGTIIDSHSNKPVGKLLNYNFIDKEVNGKLRKGILLTGQIFKDYKLDDEVWDKIKKGIYKGMSFGGRAFETKFDFDNKATLLKNLEGYEWSVCEQPANPEATFQDINYIAKSHDIKQQQEHVRDLGDVVAIFDDKNNAEEYIKDKEGLEIKPTQSGKWAVLKPFKNKEVKMLSEETIKNINNFITDKAEYPWEQCIADMKREGKSDESAKKICAAIKNRSVKHSLDKSIAKDISEAVGNISKKVEEDDLYSYILNKMVEKMEKEEKSKMVETKKQDEPQPEQTEDPLKQIMDRLNALEEKVNSMMTQKQDNTDEEKPEEEVKPEEKKPEETEKQGEGEKVVLPKATADEAEDKPAETDDIKIAEKVKKEVKNILKSYGIKKAVTPRPVMEGETDKGDEEGGENLALDIAKGKKKLSWQDINNIVKEQREKEIKKMMEVAK